MNKLGFDLIKQFEGCRLQAYPDQGGVLSIGYGSTRGVTPGMVITQEEAEQRLDQDLIETEKRVGALVRVPLNENQRAAIECLTFNIGSGNLATSTLLRELNSGVYTGAADQFLRWVKVKGIPDPGLMRRRQAERQLFLTPVNALS